MKCFIYSFLSELIVNRILIVSVLLSFHLYLVDYFIKDILLFESKYFIIIIIIIHVHIYLFIYLFIYLTLFIHG